MMHAGAKAEVPQEQPKNPTNISPQLSPPAAQEGPATPLEVDITDRFTRNEKWFIVLFTAFVGFFSPLTANIYFPAIPTIARAFNKSNELINLTVTVYMVFQGIAPMLWGPVSDHLGRRPISATCLLILSLSCIGLALVPTSDYWLLLLLRCVQSSGSASTIAIGAGIIGDISSRAERGGFYGLFVVGPMIGPAVGPVIGGALSESLGWRSIFWCLAIMSAACFTLIFLLQPETLRTLSNKTTFGIYRPVIPLIGRKTACETPRVIQPTVVPKVPKNPFRLFLRLDIDVLLLISAMACTVFYGVITPLSTLFVAHYPFLSETEIGLSFLGIGVGMAIGSSANGWLLDREYQQLKRKREKMSGRPDADSDVTKEEGFQLEMARLRLLPIWVTVMACVCAGYGWSIQTGTNLAIPIVLQFILGIVSIAIMNATATLMIDLCPGQSSSITACNNLVRCTFSAVLVSTIEFILRSIGEGWTYVIHCGISLLILPLIHVAIRFGPSHRIRRQRLHQAEVAAMIRD